MKLNEQLNLVVPVRADDEGNATLSAFHVPISRDVFDANYAVLAATKAALASKGVIYQMDAGPRIASRILRDEGKTLGDDGIPRDGASALLAEIKRLTTILSPTADGWEQLPIDSAIGKGILDTEEWDEVLSQIVFFTCHYALGRKAERPRIAEATASLLNASITSSSPTEWIASLPKSTKVETLAAPRSSIPS